MSDSEILVRCDRISKKFCRDLKKSLWYGVRDVAADLNALGKRYRADINAPRGESRDDFLSLREDEFCAVKDISFVVRRGECLGLIGRNGAGKTTLLKMLNGLIKPDHGRIEIKGRVGALIALGAGFSPILSGRENIYINGSILGLGKREIDAKFDAIVDFAELSEFIDAPVQNYSSGMKVRLGFAVAAELIKPDILLLDEVLAVGDIGFTIKCLNAVRQMMQRSAVVFVSHNMQFVSRFCTRALVLTQGKVVSDVDPFQAIAKYHSLFSTTASAAGTGGATVVDARLVVDGRRLSHDPEPRIKHGAKAEFHCNISLERTFSSAELRVDILDPLKVQVAVSYLGAKPGDPYIVRPGPNAVILELGKLELNLGRYSFIVAVIDPKTGDILHRSDGNAPFSVDFDTLTWGSMVRFVPARITLDAMVGTTSELNK